FELVSLAHAPAAFALCAKLARPAGLKGLDLPLLAAPFAAGFNGVPSDASKARPFADQPAREPRRLRCAMELHLAADPASPTLGACREARRPDQGFEGRKRHPLQRHSS